MYDLIAERVQDADAPKCCPSKESTWWRTLLLACNSNARPSTPLRLSPVEIVTKARRQAALLSDVPRAEVAARFEALAEEIRGQALAQGTAIEGDWLGD